MNEDIQVFVVESDSVEDMRQLARELWEKRRKRKTNLKFD